MFHLVAEISCVGSNRGTNGATNSALKDSGPLFGIAGT